MHVADAGHDRLYCLSIEPRPGAAAVHHGDGRHPRLPPLQHPSGDRFSRRRREPVSRLHHGRSDDLPGRAGEYRAQPGAAAAAARRTDPGHDLGRGAAACVGAVPVHARPAAPSPPAPRPRLPAI